MKAAGFTRNGCTLGDRFVTYTTLSRWYVCNECGGQVTHKIDDRGDRAECAECGGTDFITAKQFDREVVEAWEVERGLPEHLRETLGPKEPPVGFERAVAELFG